MRGGEGTQGPARDPQPLRPAAGGARVRRVGHRDRRRDQQRAAADARGGAPRRPTTSTQSGADVIDIGCTPGLAVSRRSATWCASSLAAGMRVSVDTFDPDEIRTAVAAGAELVLSVNGSNIEVARDLAGTGARVVVVPDLGGTLETLEPSLEKLAAVGRPLSASIRSSSRSAYGFMASLERYAEVRRRYPAAEMLMGIGNLTELTAADSTGVNALLIAVCQELGVRAVLTTEVIPWARGAVREVDVARRLMHYAVTQRTTPKGRGRSPRHRQGPVGRSPSREDELRALQAGITDPNFRIFADREGITVLNNERFVRGTDITSAQIVRVCFKVDEATHAVLPWQRTGTGQPRGDTRKDLPSGGRTVVGLSNTARRCQSR